MEQPNLFTPPTASQSMKSNKEKIRRLMREFPDSRNSDRGLCVRVWKKELIEMGMDYTFFFLYYAHGKLTESGVITRLARMIRNEEGWKKPKKEEEELVKQFVKK